MIQCCGIAVVNWFQLEFSDHIAPVCLPESSTEDVDHLAGDLVTLTGWGTATRSELDVSSSLRRAALAVFPKKYTYIGALSMVNVEVKHVGYV